MTIDLKDIDLLFVSYDELGKDAFYDQARKVWPGSVKRVDGVHGIHNAYKAADRLAETDWFLIVDGDTWIWDNLGFESFSLPAHTAPCVYSFGSINKINDLCYGNGGPKLWKKGLIGTRNTHDVVNGSISVDFFTTFKYYQINQTFSTTVVNQCPLQAARAGYREAVKFMSNNGKILNDWQLAMRSVANSNLSRVHIWSSTGIDVEHGIWAIYGARLGLVDYWTKTTQAHAPEYLHKQSSVRYQLLNDYQALSSYLTRMIDMDCDDCISAVHELGRVLHDDLGFWTPLHDANTSKWVKNIYQNPTRNGFI